MKGDYSQPGLMPGPYLEQIDLPSAYLVYAEVVSGGRLQLFARGRTVSYRLISSARFLHDLAEITVLIEKLTTHRAATSKVRAFSLKSV
jgi:hypothetical protein